MDTVLDTFFDCRRIRSYGYRHNIIYGPRGTGKTYSGLQMNIENNLCNGGVIDDPVPFIYMRRMSGQAESVTSRAFNPFKRLNCDMGLRLLGRGAKNTTGHIIYNCNDKWLPESDPMAYAVALKSMGSMKGIDASDVECILFDEFTATGGTDLQWSSEGTDFMNAYETINRNREFFGEQPVQTFLLSNSETVSNPITDSLGVSDALEKMARDCIKEMDCGNVYLCFAEAAITDFKRETDFYKNSHDKVFNDIALDNKFAKNNLACIRQKVPLTEYKPFFTFDGVYYYIHKSRPEFYACEIRCKAPTVDQTTDRMYLAMFDQPLRQAALSRRLYYSNYRVKRKVLSALKLM